MALLRDNSKTKFFSNGVIGKAFGVLSFFFIISIILMILGMMGYGDTYWIIGVILGVIVLSLLVACCVSISKSYKHVYNETFVYKNHLLRAAAEAGANKKAELEQQIQNSLEKEKNGAKIPENPDTTEFITTDTAHEDNQHDIAKQDVNDDYKQYLEDYNKDLTSKKKSIKN